MFQIFLDDVGVLVAMIAITLLAIIVVTIKVVIFQPTVTSSLTKLTLICPRCWLTLLTLSILYHSKRSQI